MAAHCQVDNIRSACQLDCVRLTTDAVHGRILVATRDIDVGEVVLAEKPLLVWQSDGRGPSDVIEFLDAYDAASEETRLAVADFYCPDLDGQKKNGPGTHVSRTIPALGRRLPIKAAAPAHS